MKALPLALLLGACAATGPEAPHHVVPHSDHPYEAVVDTSAEAEQAITNELTYRAATLAYIGSGKECDYYEAQAFAALLYARTATPDAKVHAQFKFNHAIREFLLYVEGRTEPPEGWC